MQNPLPAAWRWVCLAHFLIALVFGLVFLFAPDMGTMLLSWSIIDPLTDRMVGAALLAMGIAHFQSARQTTPESVKILLQMYLVFDFLGTAIFLWVTITYSFASGWPMLIFGPFFAAYCYFAVKK